MVPFVSAENSFFDKLFSLETNKGDGICQDFEFPLLNQECNVTLESFNNLNIFEFGWFVKLFVFVLLFFLYKNKQVINDPNVVILTLVIIFALIAFPERITETFINEDINNITINETNILNNTSVGINDTETPRLVIPKSSIDTWWENLWSFPRRIYPERPWLGWIIFLLLIPLVWHGYGKLSDWYRKKVGRK